MIQATRNWFRRNRTPLAIGAGVIGLGYLAGQYLVGTITEARQRMSDERIARENIRRRFRGIQKECTDTVLGLLQTSTEIVFEELPVEEIYVELKRQKADKLIKTTSASSNEDATSLVSFKATDDNSNSSTHNTTSSGVIADIAPPDSAIALPLSPPPKKQSKAELWNKMKIDSITRAFTLIYTLALVTLLTRVQLNLLGRQNYLESVISLSANKRSKIRQEKWDKSDAIENPYESNFNTNTHFLHFSWWVLHQGCKDIMALVHKAVEEVFGSVWPNKDLSLIKLVRYVVDIRKRVEGATEKDRAATRWLPYLLPLATKEAEVLRLSGVKNPEVHLSNPPLRKLINETSDLIDSPNFNYVLSQILDAGFRHLVENKIASDAYKLKPMSDDHTFVEIDAETTALLAASISVFYNEAHLIGSWQQQNTPNEYLTEIQKVADLDAFSAVIYGNFEDELPENQKTLPKAVAVVRAEDDDLSKAWVKALGG